MPSTLGIVASHIRPVIYTITPDALTVGVGRVVTWSINASNFGSGTIYYTLLSQTNSATTADFTDAQVSGSIAITNDIGTLTKTFATTSEIIDNYATVLLRTGSITGPIVATAPTVTRVTPTYSSTPSYDLTFTTRGNTINTQSNWDGRWFKIEWTRIQNARLLSVTSSTQNLFTRISGTNYPNTINSYGRLYSSDFLVFSVTHEGAGTTTTYTVRLYPQTNSEIN